MGSDNNKKDEDVIDEPNYVKLIGMVMMMLAIGTGMAVASVRFDSNKSTYDTKIEGLQQADLQWLYLALVVLGRMIAIVNFVPMGYKNNLKGNIRSNPFFYNTEDENKTLVVFKNDGSMGMYNRSNRSIQHMVENIGVLLASIGPVGYVFPKQTFGTVCVFSLGRILHQKGYSKGYGKHAIGFLLSTLSVLTIEGLSLIVFLKASKILSE
ncbi:hypothetical protein FRACYDRAFT_268021 [Fragilariopsis cylindrus CCMP1102]|uniref:Uncharacterized protein n=1 Tax=Fragilariopsis cylindrus CCMP1102 TaxID=635003 RepID=A0A1E7FMM8_9STRA|nr:hypothetical protein FRACYDRAFT_268021 [Fragilariopsis cylindrus CCMP1102]|eukprot:OEU19428.1 hypothetical protein FRACYDRAFT_268021 [Fragilariopsis cylindrus CCMP1102]